MIIDLVFLGVILMAVIKGYRKGFIIAIFSIFALLAGLAAAVKLSVVAAGYLESSVNVSSRWLPVISFALVFLLAVLIVNIGARAIEKTIELAMLGWINRLAGILLYIILYTVVYSVVLFYVSKINLLTPSAIAESKTYAYIQPWGPKAIGALGIILPFFKNMFHELETFFGKLAEGHSR